MEVSGGEIERREGESRGREGGLNNFFYNNLTILLFVIIKMHELAVNSLIFLIIIFSCFLRTCCILLF